MKGNTFLYLLMYLILRIYINVKNCIQKKDNFGTLFSIVHISLDFALRNIKFLVSVDDIHPEGTVSQNFDLCLSFCFMSKNGQLFNYFFIFCSQNLIKNELSFLEKI